MATETEWILQNYRCSYDEFSISDDGLSTLPPGEYRRKVGFLDCIKTTMVDLYTGDYLPVGWLRLLNEITQCDIGDTLFNPDSYGDWESAPAFAELQDRVVEYDKSQAGVLNVVESWKISSSQVEEKVYDIAGLVSWVVYVPSEEEEEE
jgi:hypothetical protein